MTRPKIKTRSSREIYKNCIPCISFSARKLEEKTAVKIHKLLKAFAIDIINFVFMIRFYFKYHVLFVSHINTQQAIPAYRLLQFFGNMKFQTVIADFYGSVPDIQIADKNENAYTHTTDDRVNK